MEWIEDDDKRDGTGFLFISTFRCTMCLLLFNSGH